MRRASLGERYDGAPGAVYLIRPDQHVAARWRAFDAAKIERAIARACAAGRRAPLPLNLNPNIPDPDGFYQELIDSQRDFSQAEAEMMNCRLVLILANHIGDREILREALKVAGGRVEPGESARR